MQDMLKKQEEMIQQLLQERLSQQKREESELRVNFMCVIYSSPSFIFHSILSPPSISLEVIDLVFTSGGVLVGFQLFTTCLYDQISMLNVCV